MQNQYALKRKLDKESTRSDLIMADLYTGLKIAINKKKSNLKRHT